METMWFLPWLGGAVLYCLLVVAVSLVVQRTLGVRKAQRFFLVAAFPVALFDKMRQEIQAARRWQQGFSERRKAEQALFTAYRIVIPECLVVSRRGGDADRLKVRKVVDPMLYVLASSLDQACRRQRILQAEGREIEERLVAACLKRAQRQLYDLWDPLNACGVYPADMRSAGYADILRVTKRT